MNAQTTTEVFENRPKSLLSPTNLQSIPPEQAMNFTNLSINKSPFKLRSSSIFAFQEDDNIAPYFTNDYHSGSSLIQMKPILTDDYDGSESYFNRETKVSIKSNLEQTNDCNLDSFSSMSAVIDSNANNYSFSNSTSPIKTRLSFNTPPLTECLSQRNTLKTTPSFNHNFSCSSNQIQSFSQMLAQQEEMYLLANLPFLLIEKIGCINVQKKLYEKRFDYDWIVLFFERIRDNLVEIVLNQFGNYAIQKLIEIVIAQGNKAILLEFFELIKNDLYSISIHKFGTIVIQTILELLMKANVYSIALQMDELNEIFEEFITEHMLDLCNHKCGNHVFQKFLYIFPHDKNQFIYTQANEKAFNIVKLQQGACIVHSLILNGSAEQRNQLITAILEHLPHLINDENANYTIQFIVEVSEKKHKEIIYAYIKENMHYLVKEKCASNVIDKCLKINEADNGFSKDLIRLMLKKKMIKELICNCYGNYIVQNALKIAKGSDFNEMINQIKQSFKVLQKSTLGKQILESLKIKYPDIFK